MDNFARSWGFVLSIALNCCVLGTGSNELCRRVCVLLLPLRWLELKFLHIQVWKHRTTLGCSQVKHSFVPVVPHKK